MNYKVYQGTELKQTVTSKTAVMNGLQPNKTYDFGVEADNAQTGADGKTRYLHTAYADSADGTDGFYVDGGTNLLTNTGDLSANWDLTKKVSVDTSQKPAVLHYNMTTLTSSAYTIAQQQLNDGFLQPSTTYTASFYAKGTGTFMFFCFPSVSTGVSDTRTRIVLTSDYKLYTITFTTVPNLSGNKNFLLTQVYSPSATDQNIIEAYVYGLKLETGTTATPWCPAPSEAHPTYIGFYTDFTQVDSTNPLDYVWSPNAKTSVTTRGIRFNIPKTLTVGSTITLRYEEYPLGIVPIGNEPSGMFGGGNRQNLSAKVISTANGSSVVEVAGNVIDVGNKNLFKNTTNLSSTTTGESWSPIFYPSQVYDSGIKSLSGVSAITFSFNVYVPSNVEVGEQCYFQLKGQNSKATDWGTDDWNTLIGGVEYAIKQDDLGKTIYLNYSIGKYYKYQSLDTALADTASIIIRQGSGAPGLVCSKPKLETGDQVTPYASFVDGDTFTAQPNGTFALFSEYKALYY